MGTVTVTGTQEQLLRMARVLTEAAQESKDKSAITVTIDNAPANSIGSVQSSGGTTRKV